MTFQTPALLLGLVALAPQHAPAPHPAPAASAAKLRLAQAADSPAATGPAVSGASSDLAAPGATPAAVVPNAGVGVTMPGMPLPKPTSPSLPPNPASPQTLPRVPVLARPQPPAPVNPPPITPPPVPPPTVTPPADNQATANPTAPTPAKPAASLPQQAPSPSGASRNGGAILPTLALPSQPAPGRPSRSSQPNAAVPTQATPTISYGGPQIDVQPVYGSALRDNGSSNNGVPIYNSVPGINGAPINGTANAYYETLPPNTLLPGQVAPNGRNGQSPPGYTSATRQPLGASTYSRDQSGTFDSRNGYNGQGVYTGTTAQTGGIGYGSPYAPSGRPVGGLLSTGVDATGPLRPYIPLNSGTITRPNTGYGVPNGSRPSRMDANGIQRVN